ncbi:MAG: heme-binding protein [Cocleimonas sp.]
MKLLNLKSVVSTSLIMTFFVSVNTPVFAEDEQLTYTIKRLSGDAALKVAQTAMLECRKLGYQVTATVVDKNGIVQSVVRDTLAPPVSIGISKDKAYTAVNFSVDTSEMASRANTPVGSIDGVLMSAGGVNVNIGGTIYGAVGVSGAPSGETDEACAKAGIEAIAEDLEMAD